MKTFEMAKATCKKLSGDLILENYFCNSKKMSFIFQRALTTDGLRV